MKKGSSKTTKRENETKREHEAEAKELAQRYRITLSPHPTRGFVGSAVEMPMVLAHGKTPSECVDRTRDALAETVLALLELGEHPPSPADEQKRETQLNVRLTADERLRIAELARVAGFRSISDYMRWAALRNAS